VLGSELWAYLVLGFFHGLGESFPILLRLVGFPCRSIYFIVVTHPQTLVVLCKTSVHVIKSMRKAWPTFCNSRARFSILIFV
jgi:hypothetical protein